MNHHDRQTGWSGKTLCLFIISAIVTLVFLSPTARADKPPAKKPAPPVINVQVSPDARLTIFQSVILLPALTDGGTIDQPLSAAIYRALVSFHKYHILRPENVESWLEKKLNSDEDLSMAQLAHQAGIDLRASAIITVEAHPRQKIGELLVRLDSTPVTTWNIIMWDTRNGQPVWKLTVSHQEVVPAPEKKEETATILAQAITALEKEMISRGDIFSTQLPRPEILSTQGDIRSVRIVLQPDPPHIFSQYQLLRAEDPKAVFRPTGPPVANKTPLILIDRGLRDATSYYYTVIGINKAGMANVPAPPFAITTTGAPTPVKSLHAAGGSLRHIQLFWEPSQDPTVKEYVIYRSVNADGPFKKIAIVSGRDRQTYIDKGQPSGYSRYGELADNSRYFYIIRTRNIVGVTSEDSQVVSAVTKGVPQPPTNLQAIDRQPKKIPLTWEASSDPDVVGYAVFRAKTPKGPFQQIEYVGGRENQQYVDVGSWEHPLQNNTTYWYRLRAVNVVEAQSPDSGIVSAITKAAPQAVIGVAAANGLFRKIILSWQPNPEPDIDHYEIYRGTIADNIRTKITTIGAEKTTYTDMVPADSRTYWYRIRAVDQDGLTGAWSAVVHATTKHPPVEPKGLKAIIGPSGILLSWEKNPEPDIDHYEISNGSFLSGRLGDAKKTQFFYPHPVKPGSEFKFMVRAVDQDGLESAYSEPLVIMRPE
ncbi:MAG: hypothetical protein DSY57_03960 [Desulfobulbus sp.]|nr:MAG: hypothetical protein DSY57_03960 [Desulfobulbus sp.]